MITACPQCRAMVQTRDEVPVGSVLRCHACGSRFALGAPSDKDLRLKKDSSDLKLPALDEVDEMPEPPEVGPPVDVGGDSPFSVYTRVYHRIVAQLGADVTFALLLLALHLLVVAAYGVGESARISASFPADIVGYSPDMLVRVWRPLALYEVMTVGVVAMAYWVGFMIAVRSVGMDTSSGGFCANWGLATIPGTICLGAAWFAEWPVGDVAIPSVFIALPVVLLFTCAIFSVRLVMSLIITLICMALAGPASVFAVSMYDKYAQYSMSADEERLAADMGGTRPATVPAGNGSLARIPKNAKVREMANVLVASAGGPEAPAAPAAAPAPTGMRKPRPATAPAAPQGPDLSGGVTLEAWSGPGTLQQVIWPPVAAEFFGTLSADALGNHVIDLWLARDLSAQGTLRIGGGPSASYALSPSGNLLVRVLSTAAPIAEVWNVRASRRQTQVSLSGNGTPAALGFLDNENFAIVWRAQSRLSVSIYDGQTGALGRTIAWPEAEKRPAGANQGAGGQPGVGQGNAPAQPEAVWISPDGKLLAGIDGTPRICVLDTATGQPVEQWRLNLPAGQAPAVSGVAFARGNLRLAVLVDENQNGGQSSLFVVESGVPEITAIPFSSAVWKLAGCSGPSGRRGRVIDWISDTELLLYGELVADVSSGALTQSMHTRDAGKPARGGVFSQYRLPDGSFLLEPATDNQGRKAGLQRLRFGASR